MLLIFGPSLYIIDALVFTYTASLCTFLYALYHTDNNKMFIFAIYIYAGYYKQLRSLYMLYTVIQTKCL